MVAGGRGTKIIILRALLDTSMDELKPLKNHILLVQKKRYVVALTQDAWTTKGVCHLIFLSRYADA